MDSSSEDERFFAVLGGDADELRLAAARAEIELERELSVARGQFDQTLEYIMEFSHAEGRHSTREVGDAQNLRFGYRTRTRRGIDEFGRVIQAYRVVHYSAMYGAPGIDLRTLNVSRYVTFADGRVHGSCMLLATIARDRIVVEDFREPNIHRTAVNEPDMIIEMGKMLAVAFDARIPPTADG